MKEREMRKEIIFKNEKERDDFIIRHDIDESEIDIKINQKYLLVDDESGFYLEEV